MVDGRQPGQIQHDTLALLRQGVFAIACGYADCNDAARLGDDAIHKLLVDRDPIAGSAMSTGGVGAFPLDGPGRWGSVSATAACVRRAPN